MKSFWKSYLQIFYIEFLKKSTIFVAIFNPQTHPWIQPKREKEKNLNLVFRHRRAFKPQPEITWIVQILSKKLRHSLFYVFWLNIGLRAYWVTSILPGASFVRLLCLNTRYRVYSMIDQKHSKRPHKKVR